MGGDEMTPTPRTDANESITCKEGDPCIAPDFARQLERENFKLRAILAAIADADSKKWGVTFAEFDDQFRPWAQNIARHTLQKP